MSPQASLNIRDQDPALVLPAINAANIAMASMSSGPTAPPNPVSGQLWRDVSGSEDVLRVWNEGDSKWEIATFGAAAPGSLVSVASDATLDGTGNVDDPLTVANPFTAQDKAKLDTLTAGGGPLTQEKVYDQTKEIIKAGSNVTVTRNDSTNELTIASSGGGSGSFDFDELKDAIIQGQGTSVFVDEDDEKIAINALPQNGRFVFVGQGSYGAADPAGTTRTFDTNIPASATDTDRNQFILYFTNQLTTSDSLGATPVQFVLRNIVRTDSAAAVVAVRTTGTNRIFRVWQTSYTPAGKTDSFVRLHVKRVARQRSDDIHVRMFTSFSPKSPIPTDGNVIEGNVLKGPPGPPGTGAGGKEALNTIAVLQDKTADLEAGPESTGWANASLDTQGGIALQEDSAFTGAEAEAATYSLNPQSPAGKYFAVRVPAASNARTYRIILTAKDGTTYQYDLSSLHKLAGTSSWDYYGDSRDLGLSLSNLVLQVTSSSPHVGESTFAGNLVQQKVFDQAKEIVKGGDNISVSSDDTTDELTVNFDGVTRDATLSGDGSVGSVLRVANPFTAAEKAKLAGLGDGLSEVTSDSSLSGLGTVDSPLEIVTPFTASEKVKLDELEKDVTSDSSLTGAGTSEDPLKVANPFSASDKAKLDTLVEGASLSEVETDSTLTGDGTSGDVLKVANPYTTAEKTKLSNLSEDALLSVSTDATISGTGTSSDPLKVANPYTAADKAQLDDLVSDALTSVSTDSTLTGVGITSAPLKVENPFTKVEKAKLANLSEDALDEVVSDGTIGGKGTNSEPLKVSNPFTLEEKAKLQGLTGGTSESLHALEVLQDKTYDLTAGPASSGWTGVTNTGQGGMAVKQDSPYTLAQARGASYGISPDSPGGKYLAVRLPVASVVGQARVVITGPSNLTYTLQLSSFHKLGQSSTWAWYGENLPLGMAVVGIKLELTGSASHLGQSSYAGSLSLEKVYEQNKNILKAGSNITISQDDADSEIVISSTATGGGTAEGDANTDVLDHRVDALETKTSDLVSGPDSTGWFNASSAVLGGIYTGSSALSLSQAEDLASNLWTLTITSNIGEHLLARIRRGANAAQYRVEFRSGQDNLFEAPLTTFEFLGHDTNWSYFRERQPLGTDIATLNLQVTGDRRHVGTSTYEGNLTQGKVYTEVDKIVKAGSNITISRNSDRGELTIAAAGGTSGLSSVSSDGTLTGDGTSGDPLKVANPFSSAEKTKLAGLSSTPGDGTVTTDKIANGAVTSDKIGSFAVVSSKLGTGSVTNAKIASSAVNGGKIANNSITGSKIVQNSISTSKIVSRAVSEDKLADVVKEKLLPAPTDRSSDSGKVAALNSTGTAYELVAQSAGGLTTVSTNSTITGDGSAGKPLGVAIPYTQAEKTKLANLSSTGGGTLSDVEFVLVGSSTTISSTYANVLSSAQTTALPGVFYLEVKGMVGTRSLYEVYPIRDSVVTAGELTLQFAHTSAVSVKVRISGGRLQVQTVGSISSGSAQVYISRAPRGIQGDPGKDGAAGARGPAGARGLPGRDGRDGVDGQDGAAGQKGDRGERGLTGAQGRPGATGARGERGLTGAQGRPGATGARGPQGIPGPAPDSDRLLPDPTNRSSDAGKVAALNSGGTAYELVEQSGSGGSAFTGVIVDSTLNGDGTSSSPLKVARPFTASDKSKLDGLSTTGLLRTVATNNTISGNGTSGSPLAVAIPFTQAEKTKLAGLSADGGGGTDDEVTDHRIEALEDKTSDIQRGIKATGWFNASSSRQGGFYVSNSSVTLSQASARTRNNQWVRVLTSGISQHIVVRIPTNQIASQYRIQYRSGTGTLFNQVLTSFIALGTSGSWKYYIERHTLGSDVAGLTMQVTDEASLAGQTVFEGKLTKENVYGQAKNVIKGGGGISATGNDTAGELTLALASKGVTLGALADAVAKRLLPATLGSAGQTLQVNSAGNAVQYATPSISGGFGTKMFSVAYTPTLNEISHPGFGSNPSRQEVNFPNNSLANGDLVNFVFYANGYLQTNTSNRYYINIGPYQNDYPISFQGPLEWQNGGVSLRRFVSITQSRIVYFIPRDSRAGRGLETPSFSRHVRIGINDLGVSSNKFYVHLENQVFRNDSDFSGTVNSTTVKFNLVCYKFTP